MSVLYNIVSNEGKPSSVTVFGVGGQPLVATKDHPAFTKITDALTGGVDDPQTIKGLFDISVGINDKFARLSERVTAAKGMLFFDGDEMNTALSQTILTFYAQGNEDFKPLVAFLDKVMMNPNEHSREQLFGWLRKHRFGICADGDIIAYKGIKMDGKSDRSGAAMVNGVWVQGRIPNQPDTIIEMPRSKVHHDPRNGCSTGLHVANFSFAKGFSSQVVRVKVNPRDVVSVPTDSGEQKMRVCRYRVLEERVTKEDKTILFTDDPARTAVAVVKPDEDTVPVGRGQAAKKAAQSGRPAAAKAAAAKEKPRRKPAELVWPKYYEEYTAKHFSALPVTELRWLAKEWELAGHSKSSLDVLVPILTKEARARKRTW